MAAQVVTKTKVPTKEFEKRYVYNLQAKNVPIITKYINYSKLTDEDNILCVNPATNE